MDKILQEKIQKNIDKYGKIWDNTFSDYLVKLNEFIVYTEKNKFGEEYQAVRGFNEINGYGRTKGVGLYACAYFSMIDKRDIKNEWVATLEGLNFVNGKLVVLGNHGEFKSITHDELVNEFIRIHLN